MNQRLVAIGDFDPATRSFPVVASTKNPVRGYEEIGGKTVERLESLETWDLTRFNDNPIVLEVHDQGNIRSIVGRAELRETELGLEGRVFLAPLNVNPKTFELEQFIKDGYLRGLSVGFTFGERTDEVRDGVKVAVFRKNELNELSLVPVPADAGALTRTRGLGTIDKAPTPEQLEEQRKVEVSEAAKKLASARRPKMDAADDEDAHFDQGRTLGNVERTQIGGIRVKARLTRTGVLRYVLPDGTVSYQLRPPEEVFDAASLATLKAAPVTDLAHHTTLISSRTYRDAALGHVDNVRQDGKYVVADLFVNDAETAAAIERGDLADISCGYVCKHDNTPGVFEGQAYDLVHRSIRYNHAAVLPPGRGRAGPDVSIFDSSDQAVVWIEQQEKKPMEKTFIKLDGKDYEFGSQAHFDKVEQIHNVALTAATSATKDLQAKFDALEGKFDAKTKELEGAKKSLEDLKKEDAEKGKKAIRSRVRLIMKALRLFGEDEDEEGDDEKKADAKFDALDELTDREIMLKVINGHADYKDVKFDAKSDEYVTAIFDSVSTKFKRADSVDSVVAAHRQSVKLDAADEASVNADIERQKKAAADPPWKRPLQMTKQV